MTQRSAMGSYRTTGSPSLLVWQPPPKPLHLVLDVRVAALGNGKERERSGLILLLRVADHGSTLHLCVGSSVALDLPAAGRCESEREYEMETGTVDARAVPLLHGIAPSMSGFARAQRENCMLQSAAC